MAYFLTHSLRETWGPLPAVGVQIKPVGGEGSLERSGGPSEITVGREEIYSWMESSNCRHMRGRGCQNGLNAGESTWEFGKRGRGWWMSDMLCIWDTKPRKRRNRRKGNILLWVVNLPDEIVSFFLSVGATELFGAWKWHGCSFVLSSLWDKVEDKLGKRTWEKVDYQKNRPD